MCTDLDLALVVLERSVCTDLDLVLVVLERFHHHQHGLELTIHAPVVTVEPVHATADVTQQANQLRLLLRAAHLNRNTEGC